MPAQCGHCGLRQRPSGVGWAASQETWAEGVGLRAAGLCLEGPVSYSKCALILALVWAGGGNQHYSREGPGVALWYQS